MRCGEALGVPVTRLPDRPAAVRPIAPPGLPDPANPTPGTAKDVFPEAAELRQMGRYRLLRRLGSGGFGAVYEAEHLALGIRVAVKLLNRAGLADARVLERFLDEARMVAQLRCPNVVVLHDYDVTDSGVPYLVMELLKGRDVGSMLCEGVLSPRRALHIAAQVCQALGEAHAVGIVHRDIKPENVVVLKKGDDPDFVKVVDFGVAKFCRGPDNRASAVLGTPAYIAPEVLVNEPLDGRSDIYALGIMLWEMIVGRLPFPGDNQAVMLSSHLHAKRSWPRELDPRLRLPDGLESLLASVIARDPQMRPLSAYVLRSQILDLLPLVSDQPLNVPPPLGGPPWDPMPAAG